MVRLRNGTCKQLVIGALPTYLKMITIETWVTNAVVDVIEDELLFGGQSATLSARNHLHLFRNSAQFPSIFLRIVSGNKPNALQSDISDNEQIFCPGLAHLPLRDISISKIPPDVFNPSPLTPHFPRIYERRPPLL
jgi:hypothetical protein